MLSPSPTPPPVAAPLPGAPADGGAAGPAGEVEWRRINAELAQCLAARDAQLESTRKELETFSFSISHDLRAPLRGIEGFARMLGERHAAGLDPEGRRLVQVLRSEARRMTQLIDDILAFSRASRQDMDTGVIDMATLARGTFQQLLEASPEASASLQVAELPDACGDRSMLRQVLVNLLGNAIKFSRRHPAPRIVVTGRRETTHVVYGVSDNGVGFDPQYADRLFGVFQRLHSQNDFEGTGLGLALVQRIVHRHGGSVWAEGAPEAGASFYFSLPLRPPGARPPA